MDNKSNIIIYTSSDGKINIDCIFNNESVWLNQTQIAELYGRSVSTINEHIKNIFKENELVESQVSTKFGNSEFSTKPTTFYNLDLIISVGYRVKSLMGTTFRIWATNNLKEYLVKGFVLNDVYLKNNSNSVYFDELLSRIRDIRSSEKQFWRKVLDIYATSIDYNSEDHLTINFFKTVQNKMHYASHGNTAAEVVFNRVDSSKDNIGLTNFTGNYPTKQDTEIAKNYLTVEELEILNKIVSSYIDVAEIQALSLKTMTMQEWIDELDGFLKMTRRDILNHNGKISHKAALDKAHKEYELYIQNNLSQVEKDYLQIINNDVKEIK